MRPTISPIIANLHMQNFEVKALSTSPHPLSLWKRYMDDTFVVIKIVPKSGFLESINSIYQCIQFTKEATRVDGSMPFQDTLVIPQTDGNL